MSTKLWSLKFVCRLSMLGTFVTARQLGQCTTEVSYASVSHVDWTRPCRQLRQYECAQDNRIGSWRKSRQIEQTNSSSTCLTQTELDRKVCSPFDSRLSPDIVNKAYRNHYHDLKHTFIIGAICSCWNRKWFVRYHNALVPTPLTISNENSVFLLAWELWKSDGLENAFERISKSRKTIQAWHPKSLYKLVYQQQFVLHTGMPLYGTACNKYLDNSSILVCKTSKV